jgi:predicted nuclease of restriction endonuclease-like RecB superfamily
MVGVLGFFMKNYLLRQVEKIYQAKKYETLAAFNKNKI